MLLICPTCRSSLEVPDDTRALVRCSACKTVFSPDESAPLPIEPDPEPALFLPLPPEPEREPEPEPASEEPKALRLLCPSCRSGLEVPAGTTALIRCPACQTVFSPADNVAPPEKPKLKKKPPKRTYQVEEEDEDEEPRKDEGKEKHRDFVPTTEEDDKKRKKRRPRTPDDDLTPQEKINRRAAFDRAAWGARLISVSLGLFMISMVCVTGFFFQGAFGMPQGWIVTLAGFLGLANWALAAVGVGLCLSGPQAPGHWGYGIAAATAVLVHAILLGGVVAQGKEFGVVKKVEIQGSTRLHVLPTRLNATMFYMVSVVYPDEPDLPPRNNIAMSVITGIAEMVRTVFIMMFLSCLARATLDEELAGRCTRTAGIASGGPGLLALIIFCFFAVMIETRADGTVLSRILLATVYMGVYTIINLTILPAFLATRDVTDACEEPFQTLIPNL